MLYETRVDEVQRMIRQHVEEAEDVAERLDSDHVVRALLMVDESPEHA